MEEALMEKTLTRLVEKVDHKYYGKYRGIVVDNNDPEKLGRLKVKVPSVLGNDVVTGWAMPCLPYGGAKNQGFFFIPEDRSGVWVEFEAGDLEFPIWVGTYWAKPGGENEVPKPADTQRPPTRKIIRTLKGNSIEMEDKDGDEVIIIKFSNGEDKTNQITMNKNGIEIVDSNKNKVVMNKDGVVVESSQIKLGSSDAVQPIVLGNKLVAWLAKHVHSTSMGPSGPPTPPPLTTSDFCSQQDYSL
jgi:uncharacterized protein involved in type VI secretion and phage assembly